MNHSPTTSSNATQPMLRVTGLWSGVSKGGRKMLSGQVSPGLKLLILENPKATGNQPPFEAFLVPAEKREPQADQSSRGLF